MRDAVSFLRGHIDGLRADVEHTRRGRLGTADLTDVEKERIKVRELAIAVLEQIANERLAEINPEYGARLIDECGKAYQAGVVQGLASAAHVIDTRLRLLSPTVFSYGRREELRHLRAAVGRLRDNHARPAVRPDPG